MNKLNVIVKLYENVFIKPLLIKCHAFGMQSNFIDSYICEQKFICISIIGFNVKQDCKRLRAAKTKTRLKTGIYLAFPKDWQDGSQNTHDGKSNSLRSPSL